METLSNSDLPLPPLAVRLEERLTDHHAIVGVVGLGYVGLPLVRAVHAAGFSVLGFDIDPEKIAALAEGRSYLHHLGDEWIEALSAGDRFSATSDFSRLSEAEVIVVCVPTPLGAHREPDLSYVEETARAIGAALRSGQLIVLESTTYPGTTRDQFLPAILEASGERGAALLPGRDFFVAYSPEREDPGRGSPATETIPRVVGGLDPISLRMALTFYRGFVEEVHPVADSEVAEAAKLLENVFRSVNIALVNEMKVILDDLGIDIWQVIEAASTKPFGFLPFHPGPGLGGHCIPIDPFYLSWKAKEIGRSTRFIELAGEINTQMPAYVVGKTQLALNNVGKAVRDARILLLGLAYKADIDDTRESPSFELIERLRAIGATVDYSDPYLPRTVPVRKHDLRMESVELTPESVASYDLILIATAHRVFDYELLAEHAAVVVDTRNAMRAFAERMGERLVRA
jgi:UDP-N-acetyl-D-glucosamine dehydrogenase